MKVLCILMIGLLVSTGVNADVVADSIPEDISVPEAESYMDADEGSASRSRKIAALAVTTMRLDLVDLCIREDIGLTIELIKPLELAPDSEFKDQATIRIIRLKSGWGTEHSEWGSRGLDQIHDLYSDIIKRRLPGVLPEPSLFASFAARQALADKLEAAVIRESIKTNQQDSKPGETPEESESNGSDPPSTSGSGTSSSSGNSSEEFSQSNWMNYLWVVIAVSGLVLLFRVISKK